MSVNKEIFDNEQVTVDELRGIKFNSTEVGDKVTGVSTNLNDFLYIVYDKNTRAIISLKYEGLFLPLDKRSIQFLNLLYTNKQQMETHEVITQDELSNIEIFWTEENGELVGFNFHVRRLDVICDRETKVIKTIKIDNKPIKVTRENIRFIEDIFPLLEDNLGSKPRSI